MDEKDREKIKQALESNRKIKRLYAEHEVLDRKVDAIERRNFLTPNEQVELKRLKTVKLRGVDQIMLLVNEVSSEAAQ